LYLSLAPLGGRGVGEGGNVPLKGYQESLIPQIEE